MFIDHSSPIPLHRQIETYLRERIVGGEYDGGRHLPTENELARRFGVARNTVRQAINKLVIEGLLVRKKGVGTKVASPNITTQLDRWHSFTQEMTAKGIPLKNFRITVKKEAVPVEIAPLLGITPGTPVIMLERLRGSEQGPFVLFISWLHPRIGLTGAEDFSRPLYDLLENDFSIIPSKSRESLRAVPAGEELANLLGVKAGVPLLFRERQVFDPGDRIIEYNIGYYRGDTFTYSIDIHRR